MNPVDIACFIVLAVCVIVDALGLAFVFWMVYRFGWRF